MKVEQLRKINEFAHNNNMNIDYRELLKIPEEDINLIIETIDNSKQNIKVVIKFLIFRQQNPEWKEEFEILEGAENFDINQFIVEKILEAPSPDLANIYLKYFDMNGVQFVSEYFRTIEEWKSYIDCLNENMKFRANYSLSNLKTVLRIGSNRCELIRKVMNYSLDGNLRLCEIKKYIPNKLLNEFASEILDLLSQGYPIESVSVFFQSWQDNVETAELFKENPSNINSHYQKAFDYMKTFSVCAVDNYKKDNLILLFNSTHESAYENMVSLFQLLEEKDEEDIFNIIINQQLNLESKELRDYIKNIVEHKEDESDFRKSLFYVFDVSSFEEFVFNKLNESQILLATTQKTDNTSMDMAKFIVDICAKSQNIIDGIVINSENLDTRKVLYEEFPKFLENNILSKDTEEYFRDWLASLSVLPSDICRKILAIINLNPVLGMSLEDQTNLKNTLLDPNNFCSLDYIYGAYCLKEEKNMKHKETDEEDTRNGPAHLHTVLELLERGNDFEQVLAGFSDEDEITPKTLIRSMAYKNNQN